MQSHLLLLRTLEGTLLVVEQQLGKDDDSADLVRPSVFCFITEICSLGYIVRAICI